MIKSSDESFFKTIFGSTPILLPKNILGSTKGPSSNSYIIAENNILDSSVFLHFYPLLCGKMAIKIGHSQYNVVLLQ
jgi:hypothetical protein